MLLVSTLLVFNTTYANGPTDQCARFGGAQALECTPASHPVSDWIYHAGNQNFASEDALTQYIWEHWATFPSDCLKYSCTSQITPGWDFNTVNPSNPNGNPPPAGVVWSYTGGLNNNEIQGQGKLAQFKVVRPATQDVSGYTWDYSWTYARNRNVDTYICPAGAQLWIRPKTDTTPTSMWCYIPKPIVQCKIRSSPATKNPCSITSGNKFKPQEDWAATVGPLRFNRVYNSISSGLIPELSTAQLDPNFTWTNGGAGGDAGSPASSKPRPNSASLGKTWTHNYNLQLIYTQPGQVILIRGNGLQVSASSIYTDTTIAGVNGWFIDRDQGLKLSQLTDGSWQVLNIKNNTVELYDTNGRLTQIKYANGQYVTVNYPATSGGTVFYDPSSVVDNFGQTMGFHYNTLNLLTSISLPSGGTITYTYDTQNRLSTIIRPGYGTKTYLYSENSTVAPSGNPNLLTGILDEKGTRYESYAYDTSDRGISTSMAGGVESYTLSYNANGYNAVTDPHGLTKNYYITTASGSPVVGTIVLMNSGSTTIQEHNYTYDAAGNIASDNHLGITTNYTYDLTRNLETSRTEAVGTLQERTITTQWDPNLPVPTLITESGKTTAYTYDNNGNALTKTVTDKTTTPFTIRTWTYTYNTVGQKLTEKTPAGETTTYAYDSNGRLITVTDALGNVTTYSNFTLLGPAATITYPNGNKVDYVFDEAARVKQSSETVYSAPYQATDSTTSTHWPQWIIDLINALCQLIGSASPFDASGSTTASVVQPLTATASRVDVTKYYYDPIGQLTSVVMPSGETLTYSYDDAHRLVGATDSLGNSITYTLNGAGDITNTSIQDPTGNIKVKTQQIFDTLGRVQQDVGNNGQNTTYGYDNLDNLTSTTDALNRSTSSTYDALNRKVTDVDALGQTVKYGYNALDQLLTITDARNNTTTYTPNAFGEITKEVSPDTGTTTRSYTNGRLMSAVDSNSMTHAYGYDDIGRVTTRTDSGASTSTLTTQYGYDQGTYGKGYLTSVGNASSTLRYSRDSAGNVIEKVMAVGTSPFRVQYKYLAGNKISDIVMPSGRHISYAYTNGKITSVSILGLATLLNNVKYGPTGIVGWTWITSGSGATDTNTFSYDLDGRMTNVTSTGVLGRGYTYDAGNRILTISDILAGIGTQSYTHDKLDRLTLQTLANQTLGYSYDANSNRTSKTLTPNGGSAISSTYSIQDSTNRINTITANSTTNTMTYLPTGQLVNDGVHQFSYDAAGRSITIQNSATGATIYNSYNGLGERVSKKAGLNQIYFVYDENGHLLGEYDQNRAMIREYFWLGDRIVGMMSKDRPGVLLRVHTDHLGTVRAVSQGDGTNTRTVLWRFEGDAFGDTLPNEDVDGNGIKFTMPIRMPGQYYDAEVGTSYNYFRDYDASTGRYVESDPIGLSGGNNTYGYVGGNPNSKIDPDGQFAFLIPFLPEIGAAICEGGGCAAAASAIANAVGAIGLGAVLSNPHNVNDYNDNNIEKISNKREYERNCDDNDPPLADPCEEAKRKLKRAELCLSSRKAFTNKWYNGVDDRHSPQLYVDLENRIKAAEREVARKCACSKK
ncbi:RHS repeat-associated core domain-containing protein [Aquirhabdus parva]|nr:RHS repeat-associated core domain-containing protein [Aquirhabdus parva]